MPSPRRSAALHARGHHARCRTAWPAVQCPFSHRWVAQRRERDAWHAARWRTAWVGGDHRSLMGSVAMGRQRRGATSERVRVGAATWPQLPVRSRCLQPGQQQGRRIPSLSSSRVRRMRRSGSSACLASSTQQMNSLRASGVMSFQATRAVASRDQRACAGPSEACAPHRRALARCSSDRRYRPPVPERPRYTAVRPASTVTTLPVTERASSLMRCTAIAATSATSTNAPVGTVASPRSR